MASTASDDVVSAGLFCEGEGGAWGIVAEAVPVQFVVANGLCLDDNELSISSGDNWSSVGLNGPHDDGHDGEGGGLCEQHVWVGIFCPCKVSLVDLKIWYLDPEHLLWIVILAR